MHAYDEMSYFDAKCAEYLEDEMDAELRQGEPPADVPWIPETIGVPPVELTIDRHEPISDDCAEAEDEIRRLKAIREQDAAEIARLKADNARYRDFVMELLGNDWHIRRGCRNQTPRWPGKRMPPCNEDCLQARRLIGLSDAPEWVVPER